MFWASEFRKIATDIARGQQYRASGLQREIFDLEAALTQKKAGLDAANLAHQRLAEFPVHLARDYPCPACWIERAMARPLRPVDRGASRQDSFACRECGAQFSVPA